MLLKPHSAPHFVFNPPLPLGGEGVRRTGEGAHLDEPHRVRGYLSYRCRSLHSAPTPSLSPSGERVSKGRVRGRTLINRSQSADIFPTAVALYIPRPLTPSLSP